MIARVVPDIPSFSVDGGFRYQVPADMSIDVGTLVRVPLGGRKVRGFVVGLERGEDPSLKSIRSVSGRVFDQRLLGTLRWASAHYVAPLSSMLRRAGPPNLPGQEAATSPTTGRSRIPHGPAAGLGRSLTEGPRRNVFLLGAGFDEVAVLAASVLTASGGSVLVVAPTAREATRLGQALEQEVGERCRLVLPDTPDAEATEAWRAAAHAPGLVLLGTPRVMLWPVADLRLGVVVDEGRRGLKDRQTPTLHARDVLRTRASVERFSLVATGLVPSAEARAAGFEIRRAVPSGRLWSLIEVIDRNVEPPGAGLLSERVRSALSAAVRRGERAVVFTHRHGYAPAFRCITCRTVRVCGNCGARPLRDGTCPRCGLVSGACPSCGGNRFEPLGAGMERVIEEVGRIVGADAVGPLQRGLPVAVITARDLPDVRAGADLAVAVDADGLILGTNYRAAEEALRVLARLAAVVPAGRGKRTMIQTARPDHPVVEALRRSDPLQFLDGELEERASYGFPPAGDLIVVEVRNGGPDVDGLIRSAGEGSAVLGPAETRSGVRWLIQGSQLERARRRLRQAVQELRDGGAMVRVDADPIDL